MTMTSNPLKHVFCIIFDIYCITFAPLFGNSTVAFSVFIHAFRTLLGCYGCVIWALTEMLPFAFGKLIRAFCALLEFIGALL